ncbi:MAG: hypothetical protein CME36_13415 [unclassified Hahellaceae]|nr:hypothetical protein [Hahellaceae bacterium]|tara:strand:- start:19560 stop:20444 length:885 start_codon:yes stop_codon:yes gene_type:complete
MQLYESYQQMADCCLTLEAAVRADKDEYPVYIPTFGTSEDEHMSQAAREAAIDAMTQLYMREENEPLVGEGILCASSDTVEAAEKLNAAKLAFKAAVMAVRNYGTSKGAPVDRVTKLINDEVLEKGYRTEALKKAMGTAGISALDLKRCYAQIRIMPPHLDVFSWTWATNHTRIKKISVEDALEMARSLPESQRAAAATAEALLATCRPGEMLVKKVPLRNQLRANYAYREDDRIVRKACPISGVVIAQQKIMPRKLWRDDPATLESETPRLPRVSGIANEPFIQALDLYRYAR